MLGWVTAGIILAVLVAALVVVALSKALSTKRKPSEVSKGQYLVDAVNSEVQEPRELSALALTPTALPPEYSLTDPTPLYTPIVPVQRDDAEGLPVPDAACYRYAWWPHTVVINMNMSMG